MAVSIKSWILKRVEGARSQTANMPVCRRTPASAGRILSATPSPRPISPFRPIPSTSTRRLLSAASSSGSSPWPIRLARSSSAVQLQSTSTAAWLRAATSSTTAVRRPLAATASRRPLRRSSSPPRPVWPAASAPGPAVRTAPIWRAASPAAV